MDAEGCVNVGYWTRLDDGRIECRLCPRFCKMRAGQRGLCFVRRVREDGEGMELTAPIHRQRCFSEILVRGDFGCGSSFGFFAA